MPRNCYFSPSSSSTLCPENPWSLFQAQLSIIPFRKSSFTRQLPPVYSLPALCFPHHVTLMYLRLLEIFSSRVNLTTHFPPVWLKKKSHNAECLQKLMLTCLQGAVLPRNVHVSVGSGLPSVCHDSSNHSPLFSDFFPCPKSL